MRKDGHSKTHKIHQRYFKQDGTQVPGVSTITKIIDKSNYLVPAAVRLTKEGYDYAQVWGEKARIGTLAHALVLSHFKGEKPDMDEYTKREIDLAENSFLKAMEWTRQHELEPILIEKPLVSEVFGFGGTLDFYGRIDGSLELLDWKSGAGIYPEMWVSLAGYYTLLEENGYKVEGRRIINIGRDETENFVEAKRPGPPLDDETTIFQACLAIYEARKRLKYD